MVRPTRPAINGSVASTYTNGSIVATRNENGAFQDRSKLKARDGSQMRILQGTLASGLHVPPEARELSVSASSQPTPVPKADRTYTLMIPLCEPVAISSPLLENETDRILPV